MSFFNIFNHLKLFKSTNSCLRFVFFEVEKKLSIDIIVNNNLSFTPGNIEPQQKICFLKILFKVFLHSKDKYKMHKHILIRNPKNPKIFHQSAKPTEMHRISKIIEKCQTTLY
jgi:hypothetical protein